MARADCIDDPRTVQLAKDNVVRLKSYLCRTGSGPTDAQVRIVFLRLSETPASLLVGKTSSALLAKTIGSPKLIENEVSAAYAGLLKQFGETKDAPGPGNQGELQAMFSIDADAARGGGAEDKLLGRKMRTIELCRNCERFFPVVDEIASFRSKIIPPGWSYRYSFQEGNCGNSDGKDFVCTKFNDRTIELQPWRGMKREDVADYAKRINAFNQLVARTKTEALKRSKSGFTDDPRQAIVPNAIKLLQYLAADSWPENFYLITGSHWTVSCVDGEGYIPAQAGWMFSYVARDINLDALLIENVSKVPIKIGGLLGQQVTGSRLRPIAAQSDAGAAVNTLGAMAETLAPGKKLLVPARITFPAPWDEDAKEYAAAADEIHRRVSANGFTGNTEAYRPAVLQDYAYGPELAIGGLLINGKQVDFTQRAPNFIDLTVASMAGSCPYLLSRGPNDDDWTTHGKVLHRAPSRAREYAETRTFAGVKTRFRLEEREPEIAFIDHAALMLTLKNGTTIPLATDNKHLAARDGDYLRLFWGEAVEIAYVLPPDVAENDVAETRFTVTGYYERYPELPVTADGASALRAERAAYTPRPATTNNAPICPAP